MTGTNGRKRAGARPAWQRLTKAQLAAAIEFAREGLDRQQITEKLKISKGALRARCRFDPLFEADFAAATREGRAPIAENLRSILLRRAKNLESPNGRDLHHALMLYDDEYWARVSSNRQRVELTGRDGGPLEHRLFDPTKLSDDELTALDELLAKSATGE